MVTQADPRIPVLAGTLADRRAGDHVLTAPPPGPAAGHLPACRCCAPRDPLAGALARLYVAAARGRAAPPLRVLVLGADAGRVAAAIAGDVVAQARFRPAARCAMQSMLCTPQAVC